MKVRDLLTMLTTITQARGGDFAVDVGLNHDEDGFCSKTVELVDIGSFPQTVMLHGGDIELAPGVTEPPAKGICREIRDERYRQVDVEGFDAQRDDEYDDGFLSRCAAAYAVEGIVWSHIPTTLWPFDGWHYKPTTRRRNLIKAAALIVAEIERLDRAARTQMCRCTDLGRNQAVTNCPECRGEGRVAR